MNAFRSLFPCAAALLLGGCANLGLNPFPDPREPDGTATLGLDPFPHPEHAEGTRGLGLDPFPDVPKGSGKSTAAATPRPKYAPGSRSEEPATEPAPAPVPEAPKAPPTPPAPKPAGDRLALKFRVGEVNRYRMTVDMSMTMAQFGEEPYMTTKQEIEFSQKTTGVDPSGTGDVEMTYDSVAMKMAMPMMGMDVSVDSRKPDSLKELEGNPMAQGLQPLMKMVGKSFQMKVRANGTVVEVKGIEKIASGPMGGPGVEEMMRQANALFSGLPDEAVRVGLSWPLQSTVDLGPMKITTRGKNTVKEWNAATKTAVVSTEATMSMEPPKEGEVAEDPQQQAMADMMKQIKIKKGEVKGEGTFDVARGLALGSKTQASILMEMPNQMGGDEPMEMSITTTAGMEILK